ncbi:hypothetical protein EVG20_g479 [Dentipellis fragilis]|uniref:Mitochondrial adapter protein MCP1 transmembrane domain-containing protein n=1 Tax=Dentipellis fragilis TaxID=205917 RepID=A0A4Y9ZEW0_9AGAM|nr:hypothetical protein EVG20_g479 [Dentipellis fragilis]
MDDSEPIKPDGSWRAYRKLLNTPLTAFAHGSAPFLTTFLLVHLSAPIAANIGGSSLSSQVMLLGREYYQTAVTEPLLVIIPLTIHATASTAKRLIAPRAPRPLTSLLSLTGYAALLALAPIHFLTHRDYPALPDPPISAVGPAELDFEFIKTALQTWPVRSWLLYGLLVGTVALHAAEGGSIIWAKWVSNKGGLSKRARRALALAGVVPVLSGLWVISSEPLMAFVSVAGRYRAALSQSIFYRI